MKFGDRWIFWKWFGTFCLPFFGHKRCHIAKAEFHVEWVTVHIYSCNGHYWHNWLAHAACCQQHFAISAWQWYGLCRLLSSFIFVLCQCWKRICPSLSTEALRGDSTNTEHTALAPSVRQVIRFVPVILKYHNHFMALFPGLLGWAGARRELAENDWVKRWLGEKA